MGASRPWLAATLVVCLLGLVGTPPTAVFVGKLTIATAAWDGADAWLAVVVQWALRTAVLAGAASLVVGLAAGVLWSVLNGPIAR